MSDCTYTGSTESFSDALGSLEVFALARILEAGVNGLNESIVRAQTSTVVPRAICGASLQAVSPALYERKEGALLVPL